MRAPRWHSLLALSGALFAMSCTQANDQEDAGASEFVPDYSDGFDQADAVAVLHLCDAPEGTLWVEDDGEVRFQPTFDMDYETSACVLKEIKESGTAKFAFVGNEKYRAGEGE